MTQIRQAFAYRQDIDGLRALAVLAVLIFHAFPEIIPGGFCGVDVFFVISGFLIGRISLTELHQNDFDTRLFYEKRIRRLVPPLVCVLLAVFGGSTLLMECGDLALTARHIAAGALFSDNLVLLKEAGYFDTLSETKPLLHLWSLGVEEQFYIICPLLFLLFRKNQRAGCLTLIFLTALSFGANVFLSTTQSDLVFYSPLTRLWEMGVGILLAFVMMVRPGSIPDVSLPGILFLATSFFGFNSRMHFPGYAALLPVLGAAMMIGSGENGLANRYILKISGLRLIGKISYSLYLWHWPLLVFSLIFTNGQADVWVRTGDLLLAFLLATLTWRYVERTTRYGGSSRIKTRFIVLVLLLIAAAGYGTWRAGGFCSLRPQAPSLITSLRAMENPYKFYGYPANLRVGVCHFVTEKEWWDHKCLDLRQHNIFLIGDSYAAALYPGLSHQRDLYYPNYGLTQLTDGNAPPFTKPSSGRSDIGLPLTSVNATHLDMIKRYQPDIVVLSWFASGSNASDDPIETATLMNRTVDDIHATSPHSRIVIIGTFPRWQSSLKEQILRYYDAYRTLPPTRMSYGLDEKNMVFEKRFSEAFHNPHAEYISSQKALCPDGECLTRLSDHASDLTAVDWGHPSAPASRYLLSHLASRVFALP